MVAAAHPGAHPSIGKSTPVHKRRHYCSVLSDHLEVRPASEHELALVVAALGDGPFLAERLARQSEDNGVLLVAWFDGDPVGCVYVWLEDAEERELREHLPGVPLLNRLKVVERWRNNGFGTKLVRIAERVAREHGRKQLALGIALENVDAERLYRRLHFEEWQHGLVDTYYVVFEDGNEVRAPERCRILVKDLDESTGGGRPSAPSERRSDGEELARAQSRPPGPAG